MRIIYLYYRDSQLLYWQSHSHLHPFNHHPKLEFNASFSDGIKPNTSIQRGSFTYIAGATTVYSWQPYASVSVPSLFRHYLKLQSNTYFSGGIKPFKSIPRGRSLHTLSGFTTLFIFGGYSHIIQYLHPYHYLTLQFNTSFGEGI